MHLKIAPESPLSPDGRALVDGSETALRMVYRASECFSFTAEELDRPGIQFLVARDAAKAAPPLGCVALCDLGSYGEVKRLFVPEEGRGKGVAQALMADLEARARALGHCHIRLETGPKLAAAVALYEALGFRKRGPFGAYKAHPASLFMEKPL